MKAPIIVNESSTPLVPGCVYVFGSINTAERYFETWYSDESFYACDCTGLRLEILPNYATGGVSITELAGETRNPDLAASFLKKFIGSFGLKIDGIKPAESSEWLRSATLSELVEASAHRAMK